MGWGGRLGWRMAGGGAVMSLAALVLFTASAGAGAAQGPAARSYAELFGARSSRHELIVKLADAAAAANLEAAARSLGGRVEPLFSASPASLAAVRARAERRAGRTLPDLSAYRRIVFSGANAEGAPFGGAAARDGACVRRAACHSSALGELRLSAGLPRSSPGRGGRRLPGQGAGRPGGRRRHLRSGVQLGCQPRGSEQGAGHWRRHPERSTARWIRSGRLMGRRSWASWSLIRTASG